MDTRLLSLSKMRILVAMRGDVEEPPREISVNGMMCHSALCKGGKEGIRGGLTLLIRLLEMLNRNEDDRINYDAQGSFMPPDSENEKKMENSVPAGDVRSARSYLSCKPEGLEPRGKDLERASRIRVSTFR